MSRKINIYTNSKTDWISTSNNIGDEASQEVLELADPVLRAIEKRVDVQEINSLWNSANDGTDRIKNKYEQKLKQNAEKLVSEINKRLQELNDSPIGIEAHKLINIDDIKTKQDVKYKSGKPPIPDSLRKGMKSGLENAGEFLAKNSKDAGNIAVKVAKFFGTKFKPYGMQKLAGNVGNVVGKAGKALGPLAVGIEVYLNYRDETEKNKIDENRIKFKAEIRSTFGEYAKTLEDSVRTSAREFATSVYETSLTELQKQRTEASRINKSEENILSTLDTIEEEARELLASFDEWGKED